MSEPSLDRRTLIAGAAVAVVATPRVTFASEPEDPILPLYREWIASRQEWCRLARIANARHIDPNEIPEAEAAFSREWSLFRSITNTTPTTQAGIAAMAGVLFEYAGPQCKPNTDMFREECEEPEAKLIVGIWRAASGQSGYPRFPQVEDKPNEDGHV